MTTTTTTTMHPTYQRIRARAAAAGSRATTVRGLICWMARYADLDQPLIYLRRRETVLPAESRARERLRSVTWDGKYASGFDRQDAIDRAQRELESTIQSAGRIELGSRRGSRGEHRALSQAARDERRAANDPAFRAQLRRRQRRERQEYGVVVHIAERYHHTVRRCYSSSRAEWVWGRATERKEWPYKGAYKSYPAKWVDPGVWIDDQGGDGRATRRRRIVIDPYRGDCVRLPMPPRKLIEAAVLDAPHPIGLLACRTDRADVLACYQPDGDRWVCCGYSIRGVAVPEHVACGDYTVADALEERNSEVRRIMIEQLPAAALASLPVVQQDDYGCLVGTYNALYLRVTNTTPEPDGSRKIYHLRVPPPMRTAREAWAWTFPGLNPEQVEAARQAGQLIES